VRILNFTAAFPTDLSSSVAFILYLAGIWFESGPLPTLLNKILHGVIEFLQENRGTAGVTSVSQPIEDTSKFGVGPARISPALPLA
jgi:hypothetical protein